MELGNLNVLSASGNHIGGWEDISCHSHFRRYCAVYNIVALFLYLDKY